MIKCKWRETYAGETCIYGIYVCLCGVCVGCGVCGGGGGGREGEEQSGVSIRLEG